MWGCVFEFAHAYVRARTSVYVRACWLKQPKPPLEECTMIFKKMCLSTAFRCNRLQFANVLNTF